MSTENLLITLLPSTDVDLGRWILQHHGVSYTERPHAPIFHILALKAWGSGKEDYPLWVKNGEKIPTVPQIMDYYETNGDPAKRLMPDPQTDPEANQTADELQHYARFTLGDCVVNWSYFHLLKTKSAVWPSITTGVPWYEKLTCLIAFPLVRSLMYKGLKLDQATADQALIQIYAGFDRFDALLADGRQYLVGRHMTYADLAVAVSLAPMILAQGYQGFLPNQAMCPDDMQVIYRQLRERPTGQFVQRIYDDHRRG
ncbi:glutathione S-transferase family protein [Parasulfitobacter algicola]|uniref:Glutathione S-transferase domain-containing protein n=1 Tax=Parasulfitobacter algicola TaxID=2614809 RepID=A0ABX2IUU2_9RHOB|nr:glutathione S-transferase domain-containing protein [Sulfitobacter algicola]NSX54607.1 glutathione S-transferase domain-containing protein [Sulfitobacter algicola]